MKITVVKKATATKVRVSCPWIVEDMDRSESTK
jgi:hypothetical protein